MIIDLNAAQSSSIDVTALKNNSRALRAGLISPATEVVVEELAPEHKSEPIKSLDDINWVCDYLLANKRYRDYMLFVVGINFGLRVSDLRTLRFSNLINTNFTFKDNFPVFEKKTRNTRKRKVNRYIGINKAVMEAVTLYLEHTPNVSLSDYMFRSQSPNGSNINRPMSRQAIDDMLKFVTSEAGITSKVSTHTLRKTFGYWMMAQSGNDTRRLYLLQRIFGHSSVAQTLSYIGITQEEITEAYQRLNLGSKTCNYMAKVEVIESPEQVG